MLGQFKKIIPIVLAILLGGVIIVVAVKGMSIFGTSVSYTAQKEKEADTSWMSVLSVIPIGKSITRVERGDAKIDTATLNATTTTNSISQKLILAYTAVQQGRTTPLSDAEAEAIATSLAQDIKLPPKTQYKLSNLNISEDNSNEAGSLYTKNLNTLLSAFADANKKENALGIVSKAMETKDASVLGKLDLYIGLYQKLEKDLLTLKTPSLIAPLHLHLVQSYESLRSATVGLKSVLTDPIVGLASFAEYQKGIDALNTAAEEYRTFKPATQ